MLARMRKYRSMWALTITATAAILSLLVLAACGGGGGATPQPATPPPSSQPSSTSLQVNVGDSPADRVIAFAMTVSSMSLTNSSGGTVSVVSSSTPVEMMRLMGTMQPLAMLNVPQGTYARANISMSSAVITYMDPVTKQPIQKSLPAMSAIVNFSPSVTIGTTPAVMNFDMDMASSVSIDLSGNVTLTPTFRPSMGTPGSGNSQDPENGAMEHLTGTVASFSGNSFTMSMMQSAQNLIFVTNSSTQFKNMSGMGMMTNGLLVMVDAVMQADGTMLAQTVESIMSMSGGMEAEGLVTAVSGSPATQLTLVVHNGAGVGMTASAFAGTITVNVGSSTAYNIDSDGLDMSNLPFTPQFDGTTIFKGQRVEAESGSGMMSGGGGGMMAGTVTASEIDLEQQGLVGSVSNYVPSGSRATFTLNVAPDSAFATLTGSTAVTVYQQAGTQLRGLQSVSNGSTVQVRGLLFFDAGAYKMVAGRIVAP